MICASETRLLVCENTPGQKVVLRSPGQAAFSPDRYQLKSWVHHVPSDSGLRYLRALNIETGDLVWEIPQVGPQEANYSGVLTTAGGLLFYGETGGRFAAVDARPERPFTPSRQVSHGEVLR